MLRRLEPSSTLTHNLPNSVNDTQAWLFETDKICKARFDPRNPLPADPHRDEDDEKHAKFMTESVIQEFRDSERLACNMHLQLSQNATISLTRHDFETRWISLARAQKEDYILKAFKITEQECGPDDGLPFFGHGKLNCPELCLDELQKDDGRGFLHLLKGFLLDDNDVPPTRPYLVPNSRFDEIIGWNTAQDKPNLKAWLSMRRLLRTRRIGMHKRF